MNRTNRTNRTHRTQQNEKQNTQQNEQNTQNATERKTKHTTERTEQTEQTKIGVTARPGSTVCAPAAPATLNEKEWRRQARAFVCGESEASAGAASVVTLWVHPERPACGEQKAQNEEACPCPSTDSATYHCKISIH